MGQLYLWGLPTAKTLVAIVVLPLNDIKILATKVVREQGVVSPNGPPQHTKTVALG